MPFFSMGSAGASVLTGVRSKSVMVRPHYEPIKNGPSMRARSVAAQFDQSPKYLRSVKPHVRGWFG